jgi:hypothetical protein
VERGRVLNGFVVEWVKVFVGKLQVADQVQKNVLIQNLQKVNSFTLYKDLQDMK